MSDYFKKNFDKFSLIDIFFYVHSFIVQQINNFKSKVPDEYEAIVSHEHLSKCKTLISSKLI